MGDSEQGVPLFGGSAKFSRYYRDDPEEHTESNIKLALELNPTRWLRYQPLPEPSENDDHVPSSSLEAMMRPPDAAPGRGYDGEFPFDGKDNWLPEIPGINRWTSPAVPFGSLQRYLESVIEAFEQECARASEEGPLEVVRNAQVLNLESAECYWEYACPDPTGLVAELETPLRGYSTRRFAKRVLAVPDFGTDGERELNSRGLRVETRAGEIIRVYAKTNRRVRFEVCYNFVGQGRFQQVGPHTRQDWQIDSLMTAVRTQATKAARDLFAGLTRSRRIRGDQSTVLSLISAILENAPDKEGAEAILSLLVHEGSIDPKGARPLKPALKALRRTDVLVWQDRAYRPHPRFLTAVETLRTSASAFPSQPERRPRR